MKFLVVGHLCLDVIHPVDGPQIESYGGIYYPIATLASLLENTDTVIPVFGVNKEDYKPLMTHLERFPNIDASSIYIFDEPTNRVHLYYKDTETRIECSRDIAPPITFERIARNLSVSGILVNMVSGFDISLETLDAIRMAIRSHGIPVHFDYHSMTLGVEQNFERYRKPVADWRRWAFMMDTVQLNEEEAAGLSLEGLPEKQLVGHLLTLGVRGAIVTRGERGASVFYNEHKHVVRRDIEGLRVDGPRDATGCGDVFGAAFLFEYVKSADMVGAAQFANRVAATKARFVGADQIHLLKQNLVPA